MDGSAKDFVNLINKVGLKDLKEKRVYLNIKTIRAFRG